MLTLLTLVLNLIFGTIVHVTSYSHASNLHVFVIGTTKSGTSTLTNTVKEHFGFVGPSQGMWKHNTESMYCTPYLSPCSVTWENPDHRRNSANLSNLLCQQCGKDEFLSYFNDSMKENSAGIRFVDKNPAAVMYPHIAKWYRSEFFSPPLVSSMPNPSDHLSPRVMLLLRNPVERLYSHYGHYRRVFKDNRISPLPSTLAKFNFTEHTSFEDYLNMLLWLTKGQTPPLPGARGPRASRLGHIVTPPQTGMARLMTVMERTAFRVDKAVNSNNFDKLNADGKLSSKKEAKKKAKKEAKRAQSADKDLYRRVTSAWSYYIYGACNDIIPASSEADAATQALQVAPLTMGSKTLLSNTLWDECSAQMGLMEGLYFPQLLSWIRMLDSSGFSDEKEGVDGGGNGRKNLTQEVQQRFLILQYERIFSKDASIANGELQRIRQFVGGSEEQYKAAIGNVRKSYSRAPKGEIMQPATRDAVVAFYKPYNKLLYRILREYFGMRVRSADGDAPGADSVGAKYSGGVNLDVEFNTWT